MTLQPIILAVPAFIGAVLLTGLTYKRALVNRVLDVPNARSSHAAPLPRGGGIATVAANTAVLAVLAMMGWIPGEIFAAAGVGGAAIALVGFLDDRNRLSAGIRLLVHIAAAVWALAWLGGLPPMQFGDEVYTLGWMGYVLGVLGIVWALNLFNFMDGIDGIAASEAVFVAVAGALAHWWVGAPPATMLIALVFGAACLGFLVWNWPPAKIFMGDVGSGYMGFVIAVLALMACRDYPVALLVWLIFGAVFVVDATITLVRRVARGERVHEAHRSHTYQWLSRRWASHKRVTLTVLAVNLLWLLPCGLLAARLPAWAGWIALGALVPLIAIATLSGAGTPETRKPDGTS
jgi:Fuc2NAc and GlcNAc transferase